MSQKNTTSTSSVLYRKHRPHTWSDVIGQESIVSVLENSIKINKIGHAYLFSGTRGTGKTTIARIFARALNVSDNDVYEIDAASNRGIDDVREIRDGVHVLPFESRYKVYIVDEVHMLTKEAFNALLKTLEEPPQHVIFILATTETDKIPETVLSRCQIFTFKTPSREVLKTLVSTVAKKEKLTLDTGVTDLIALLGDGSFRDTLGILQKVVSATGDSKITLKDVEDITGAPKNSLVNDFVNAISYNKKSDALQTISRVVESNISVKLFIALVLEKIRIVLILKNSTQSDDVYKNISEDDMKLLKDISSDPSVKINSSLLREILKAYDATSHSYIESLPLELVVVDQIS